MYMRVVPTLSQSIFAWLNDDGIHAVVEWQKEQSVGKPAAIWLGLVVPVKLALWQE